jgi:hypothetical protein
MGTGASMNNPVQTILGGGGGGCQRRRRKTNTRQPLGRTGPRLSAASGPRRGTMLACCRVRAGAAKHMAPSSPVRLSSAWQRPLLPFFLIFLQSFAVIDSDHDCLSASVGRLFAERPVRQPHLWCLVDTTKGESRVDV